ncbi:MAG: hypothetical protein E7233_01365 [Lachnospiraceae bacterium]|nr:hypothetical protein [Lachnospiraceae bacterium]
MFKFRLSFALYHYVIKKIAIEFITIIALSFSVCIPALPITAHPQTCREAVFCFQIRGDSTASGCWHQDVHPDA